MQLQEFRSSLARGGLLPSNRGLSPITPSSALSEWPGPFSARALGPQSAVGPFSAGLATSSKPPDEESLPALSPGPSSAPSGMPWPKDEKVPEERPRAATTVGPASTYVDPSGHVIPVLQVVEPETSDIQPRSIEIPAPTVHEDDAATPTEALSSPRSAEFAMAPLQPSKEADPADAFGLMSPTSTEFATSPFDRSMLLAQLGMGSMRQQDDAPSRTRSLNTRDANPNKNGQSNSLGTPAGRKLRGKISSPSIREQQELQKLQADIESKLQLQQTPAQPTFAINDDSIDDALMSPRATEFTQNPFALSLALPSEAAEKPDEAPRSTDSDPRSPAQKGVSPIIRNIGDIL